MINISDFSHAFTSWCTFDFATFSRVMRHTQVAIERNWARKVWTLSDKLIVKWMLCNLDLLPLGTLWVLLLTLDAIGKKVKQKKSSEMARNSQWDRKKLAESENPDTACWGWIICAAQFPHHNSEPDEWDIQSQVFLAMARVRRITLVV